MICRDVYIVTKEYFVHWNNGGVQATLKITASGVDRADLIHDLWSQIRSKIDGDKVMSIYCVG